MLRLIAASLAFALLSGCATTSGRVPREGNNDVYEYLGSPSRSRSPGELLDSTPEVVWKRDAGRGTLGAVAMGERITVVTSLDRFVVALNTRDGTELWRYRAINPFGTGALVAGGRVFAATEGDPGVVLMINLYSGRKKWQTKVGDVSAPLLFRDNVVYVTTQDSAVFALRADNGKRKWSRLGINSKTGPVLVGGRLAIVTLADTLVVLDAATGVVVSRTSLTTSSIAPLAVIDDSTVVMSAPSGEVTALAIPSGRVKWRQPTRTPVYGAPVVARDSVYAVTSDCTLWIIPVTGTAGARSIPMTCQSVAAPALVRDGVVIATVDGRLVYWSTVTGKQIWAGTVADELRHPPMILNGQMIVMPLRGKVVSYR